MMTFNKTYLFLGKDIVCKSTATLDQKDLAPAQYYMLGQPKSQDYALVVRDSVYSFARIWHNAEIFDKAKGWMSGEDFLFHLTKKGVDPEIIKTVSKFVLRDL